VSVRDCELGGNSLKLEVCKSIGSAAVETITNLHTSTGFVAHARLVDGARDAIAAVRQ
jgi:hypothetical protein